MEFFTEKVPTNKLDKRKLKLSFENELEKNDFPDQAYSKHKNDAFF